MFVQQYVVVPFIDKKKKEEENIDIRKKKDI
jgi:hypothetical protein